MSQISKYIFKIILFFFIGASVLLSAECFAGDCTMNCFGIDGNNQVPAAGGYLQGSITNDCCCSAVKDACIAPTPEITYTINVSTTKISVLKYFTDAFSLFNSADEFSIFHRPIDYNRSKPLFTSAPPLYLQNSVLIR